MTALKRTWGWWLAIGFFCLITFIPQLYIFGVKHLGFNLSRFNPLGNITLPLAILIAYGFDSFIRQPSKNVSRLSIPAVTACIIILLSGIGLGFKLNISIQWNIVFIILLQIILLTALRNNTYRELSLIAILAIAMFFNSFPLILCQTPSRIRLTSPLVKELQANLPEGSYFAITAPPISALPANFNATLNLSSLHTYNSLSSKRYHQLIEELGGKMQTYGRHNRVISPDFDSETFWMSNIGLIVSKFPLDHKSLQYLGVESGLRYYKVLSRMGEAFQLPISLSLLDNISENIFVTKKQLESGIKVRKNTDKGDLIVYNSSVSSPSVLILSQKFHRDWTAEVFFQSKWHAAKVTTVNGIFQGVLVPAGSQNIRLVFKPYVRYSWLGHIFWMMLFFSIAYNQLKNTVWQKNKIISGLTDVNAP